MDVARAASTLATISIFENAQFQGLRSCAGSCIVEEQIFATDLISYIGCAAPFYNTCFCNSNIIPQASSFISSCVSAACNEVADVPNAFSAWEGYCSSAGYPMNNIAQTTIDTGTSGTAVPATGQATVQTTIAPTAAATGAIGSTGSAGQSGSTSASSATSSQLNVGAIAGGAVGGVIVIGIVAIVITMLILRDRRKRHALSVARFQEQQPPAASFPPPVQTDKIPKTPVVTNNMPMWRAEENRQFEPGLQGQGRMAPELEGWGNNRPRRNVPEMQA